HYALGANYPQIAEVETREKEGLTIKALQRADGRWVDYVFFVHNRAIQRWVPLGEVPRDRAFSAYREPPPETWLLDWRERDERGRVRHELQRARLYGETQDAIERLIDARELHLPKRLAGAYAVAARELNNDVQYFMARGDDLQTALVKTEHVHEAEL